MSANIEKIINVAVKNGDALPGNRIEGKSNTGTYFISSLKDYANYEPFFDKGVMHIIDTKMVRAYQILVNEFLKENKDNYKDKMEKFDSLCETLCSYHSPVFVKVGLRINDERVFMKFVDNNEEITSTFRQILYGEYSNIQMRLVGKACYIYPTLNMDKIILECDDLDVMID